MSAKLESENAKVIKDIIEIKREKIRKEISDVKESLKDFKSAAQEAKERPMSFISSGKSGIGDLNELVSVNAKSLISAVAIGFAGFFLLGSKNRQIKSDENHETYYSTNINVSATSFTESLVNKIKDAGESVIDDLIDLGLRKEREFLRNLTARSAQAEPTEVKNSPTDRSF